MIFNFNIIIINKTLTIHKHIKLIQQMKSIYTKILFQTSIVFFIVTSSLLNSNLYAQSINLCTYNLVSTSTIGNIPNDLSGITYNSSTNTLFMVQNGDPTVYETDLFGNVLREVELKNFEDTEGIVHIGGTGFAVVEERRGKVVFFDIFSNTDRVNYNNTDKAQMPTALGPWGANVGLEGITYYPPTNKIFTVKEKTPKGYYSFTVPTSFPITLSTSNTDIVCDMTQNPFGLSDLSDIHHLGLSGATDATTGTHTLLLSHESRTLVEVDANCNEISRLDFPYINQPEGITMDNNGTIYIVAEPNLFYVFEPMSNLLIPDVPIADNIYQAEMMIHSTGEVPAGGNVEFKAGDIILLDEGFTVHPQADFSAEIEDCDGN